MWSIPCLFLTFMLFLFLLVRTSWFQDARIRCPLWMHMCSLVIGIPVCCFLFCSQFSELSKWRSQIMWTKRWKISPGDCTVRGMDRISWGSTAASFIKGCQHEGSINSRCVEMSKWFHQRPSSDVPLRNMEHLHTFSETGQFLFCQTLVNTWIVYQLKKSEYMLFEIFYNGI